MKVVILAGGRGTRLGEETINIPKPMVTIGDYPILWHIMKIYSSFGYSEFVILLGYRGEIIKDYFCSYVMHHSSFTIDLGRSTYEFHNSSVEPWKITFVDTGAETMTGGRIKHAARFTGNEPFMLTYGDGVSDIDLNELLKFHRAHKKVLTVTAVQPDGRFGLLNFAADDRVASFTEKPAGDGTWNNGGFFVCQPELYQYIDDSSDVIFEREPLEKLAASGNMYAYKHAGFWRCMDTLRDKVELNTLWSAGTPAWKVW